MSVPLSGTGGLFTRLGKLLKLALDYQTYAVGTLLVHLDSDIPGQYGTAPDLIASLASGTYTAWMPNEEAVATAAAAIGAPTLNRLVYLNAPGPGQDPINVNTLYSLQVVIAQMIGATSTVQSCTIGCTGAAGAGNDGNGVFVSTKLRGDGLIQQNAFAETITLTCTSDSQTGGAVPGSETFTFLGQQAQPDVWAFNWPLGSGCGPTNMIAVDGSVSNTATSGVAGAIGNIMVNSGFDTFTTANYPDNWIIHIGAAGTDFKQSTATTYDAEASSLQLVGGTTNNLAIFQLFNHSSTNIGTGGGGTPFVFLPDTLYSFNLFAICDVLPATGILTISLANASSFATVNDDQGNANSFTIALHTQINASTWTALDYTFRTPKQIPSAGLGLYIKATTVIPSGSNIFLDRMAMTPAVTFYAGSPAGAIFSGSVPFVSNLTNAQTPDLFTAVVTNDRGGATYGATLQTGFDRMFGMRQLGLLLPYAGSPTYSDGTYIA